MMDYILKSKAVFTGTEDKPYAGAVAVSGNKIVGVCKGKIPAEWDAERVEVLDMKDSLIMPGFSDAHTHFFVSSITYSPYVCTELIHSTSADECLEMVKKYSDEHPDLNHVFGVGWFPANWGDAELPTKEDIDKIISDKPVYLVCADGHTHWVNSKALEVCGIPRGDDCFSWKNR